MKSTAQPGAMRRQSALPRQRQHPVHIRTLFYLCGVFVVLPLFDIPFIGLSITAPLMLPVLYYALFQPALPWMHRYRWWLLLAGCIWVGLLSSCLAAGGLALETSADQQGAVTLIRYAYWILVFIVTAWVAADVQVARKLARFLGVTLVILTCLRWVEGLAFGKMGAQTYPYLLTQNYYGIQFSTFLPFVLAGAAATRSSTRLVSVGAVLLILGAAAINGSRGSWAGMGVGLCMFVILLAIARPWQALKTLIPLLLAQGILAAVLVAASGRIQDAILTRVSTLGNLEADKSYMARRALNEKSRRLFEQSPVFGVGLGRYGSTYSSIDLPEVFTGKKTEEILNRKSSHNSYLSYLAEGGLCASVPLVVLYLALAARGFLAALSLTRRGELWATSVFSGFVGMSVHLWVMSGLTNTAPWFMYGLVVATMFVSQKENRIGIAGKHASFNRLGRQCPSDRGGYGRFAQREPRICA